MTKSVFKIFVKYVSIIRAYGPFYRKPLSSVLGKQHIHINALAGYMKRMFKESGLGTDDRRIVNHSSRVTYCTRRF